MSGSYLPVITLASLDRVARGAAVAGLLCDAPTAYVVQYDVDSAAGGLDATRLHRLVLAADGVVEREVVDLEHGCLSCTIREDVLPTLGRLGAAPALVVLALPVTAEPLPVVRAVQEAGRGTGGRRLRAAAVVTAVDGSAVVEDLLGDATLAERGLELFAHDDRAVGEALAHQLEVSDVVATTTPLDARATRLVAHLDTPPFAVARCGVHDLRPDRLASELRPNRDRRGDLQQAVPSGVDDGDGVWTLDLRCSRPVHPGRLLERIEDLGSGRLRSRGHVRLATRPHTAVAWDGAGGQLSIGSLGPWTRSTPSTRVVVTGTEVAERTRIIRAFDGLALTDREYGLGARWWAEQGDDLEPWLGDLAELTPEPDVERSHGAPPSRDDQGRGIEPGQGDHRSPGRQRRR